MNDDIVDSDPIASAGIHKKNSLDERYCSILDLKDSTKQSNIEVNSEHYIRYRDERSKYKNILKSIFLDNNFKTVG